MTTNTPSSTSLAADSAPTSKPVATQAAYWTKNYRTGIEHEDPEALQRKYPYYDPISTLPEAGQKWWAGQRG
ncbi:hypothetical protein DL991_27505 [Amycolatopsis sp. WAC 01375]|uniref:hypothetical protein n=1 Tax=unclassified Amycolatopsis TaxID=2618356 RepID=UPI000F7B7523|nr:MULTISPECIES: hypothetical protein [unclassified Amycolatopsis]RSM75435.1 hypothetical protein DL991_27505 [Amycolatopsis sp. WAC 01375]RSN24779.1 hypothetical protein DL990_33355 [Amycolatopsis sp. WAC 01416]